MTAALSTTAFVVALAGPSRRIRYNARVNGETLINVTGLLAVVAWGMEIYYMWAFHLRWREHMRSLGFRESSLWTYSGYALFWPNLPERCKVPRRELLLALSAFFTLGGIMIILFKSFPV